MKTKKKKANLHVGEHGGSLLKGRRKCRRPLKVNLPLHIVIRSEFAHGPRMLLRHRHRINKIINKWSKHFKIRILKRAINTNHIHLLIVGKAREDIQNFFRVYAGHTAQEILKNFPLHEREKQRRPFPNQFWQGRIYSRLVSWFRDLFDVIRYLIKNEREAAGEIPYTPRNRNTG